LLMVYGAKDQRVPLIHGEKMRDALTHHNPNVEWVVFPDAGHGWADEETQINFWGRVEKFLAKHLASPIK
jgi:dipeptidyl aminopeptidase/acylaminoacyl peptidase